MDGVLDDLRIAEDEVCKIMKVAADTLEELQNLPQCDSDKLTELSVKYMELIKSVYGRISVHSATMTKSCTEHSDNIYTAKKESEIYESSVCFSSADSDQS